MFKKMFQSLGAAALAAVVAVPLSVAGQTQTPAAGKSTAAKGTGAAAAARKFVPKRLP